MPKKQINVKSHKRKLESGKITNVKQHQRRISSNIKREWNLDDIKTKQQVMNLFRQQYESGNIYKYNKFAEVIARPAILGEKIETWIGKKETVNYAKEGDYVVRNPGGEEYIVPGNNFETRYGLIESFVEGYPQYHKYEALGSFWGFKYQGPEFKFKAPWGEDMLVETGDMIGIPELTDPSNIYRIQIDQFLATYKKD